jgi:hypothetical protein
MAVTRLNPGDFESGVVVVEMTVSWLDAHGLHLVECLPYQRQIPMDRPNGPVVLSAVTEAGFAARDAVIQEFAKRR